MHLSVNMNLRCVHLVQVGGGSMKSDNSSMLIILASRQIKVGPGFDTNVALQ